MSRSRLGRLLAALALVAAPSAAQETPLPPALQARLALRVLSFDRTLESGSRREIRLAVLHQRRYRASLEAAEDLLAALRAADDLAGRPLRLVAVEVEREEDLARALERQLLDAVFVVPLRAIPIEAVARATRQLRIRSLTSVPAYVDQGLAVGFAVRDERPRILINLPAAQAEGADYSSQLLAAARVIR